MELRRIGGALMAKLEQTIYGDFDQVLHRIENGILNGSMSASLENSSDFVSGTARCSVRVFERYSTIGSNRVSLAVTLFQNGDTIHLSAITSGGSSECRRICGVLPCEIWVYERAYSDG